ncbi:MAG: hypothetical protein ACO319_06365 [Candidatus Nanopelagicaceae bacterium]|jgi:hypothetical protein
MSQEGSATGQSKTLSILAIVFAGVSVLILPPVLGTAAFVLAIIAVVKKQQLAILALVLSIVLPILGMVVGAAVVTGLSGS